MDKIKEMRSAGAPNANPQTEADVAVAPATQVPTGTQLGKSNRWLEQQKENPVNAMGYLEINPLTLPSGGLFYPDGTTILVRPATAAEIRQWTAVDENDPISISNGLRSIIEKCCNIQVPNQVRNWKNVIELDQFSLLFAIRDMTFKNGENQLTVTTSCNHCGTPNKIVVNHEIIKMFEPHELLMKFYNSAEKCFIIKDNVENTVTKLYLPTLGVAQVLKNYVTTRRQNGQDIDEAFILMAQYLFPTYTGLNDERVNNMLFDTYKWSTRQISAVTELIRLIHQSLEPKVLGKCSSCGSEVTAPLNFPGGFRSIFLVSDILEQLS